VTRAVLKKIEDIVFSIRADPFSFFMVYVKQIKLIQVVLLARDLYF